MDPRRHVVNSWREGGKGGRTEETYQKNAFLWLGMLPASSRVQVQRVAILMQTGNVLVISGDLADDSL
jgi:hypothetical protein